MIRLLILGAIGFLIGLGGAVGVVVARPSPAVEQVASEVASAAEVEAAAEKASADTGKPYVPRIDGESDSLAVRDAAVLASLDAATAPQPPAAEDIAASNPVAAAAVSPNSPADSAASPIPDRRLARIFAAMQPREAARVLEQMEDGDIAVILGMLGDRQAAAVLGNLTPQRAAAISRMSIRGRDPAR